MRYGILILGIPTAVIKWVFKGGKAKFTDLLFGKINGSYNNFDREKTYINALWGIGIIMTIVLLNLKIC